MSDKVVALEALNRNIRVATALVRQAVSALEKSASTCAAEARPEEAVDAQVVADFWLAADDLWRALDSSSRGARPDGHAGQESPARELSAGQVGEVAQVYAAWLDERRRVARIPKALAVRWDGLPEGHEASTSDLSEDGCFIEALVLPTMGERLLVELKTPTGREVRLQGEVKHLKAGAGFGIQFINLSELERIILELLAADWGDG